MALVIVLSMLALVTVVAVSFTMFSMMESRNARNFLKSAQGGFVMDLALGDAMHKIVAGSPQIGTNYYWVSAPGRLWRVGGINSAGATNKLFPTNQFFAPSYSGDFAALSNESGYINLYSETTNLFTSTNQIGFHPTNTFVNMNGAQRGYKIAPDGNPSGLTNNAPVPLTVQWVQIARDMTQPINSNNPVVGRYAYWVDAENARLNINDFGITNRVGWRGLSPQEFAVDGVLSGITGADLDSYRLPLPVVIGSPNLPLTTYKNTSFFRRVDDLRMAGITDANIKNNAFYLTAVGRDIEVDNGGRLPINLDAYNGTYNPIDSDQNARLPSSMGGASVYRNHPMAVWSNSVYSPRLSGKTWDPSVSGGTSPTTNDVHFGPDSYGTFDEYTNAVAIYQNAPSTYINVVYNPDPSTLDPDPMMFFGGTIEGDQITIVPGTSGSQGIGYLAPNYYLFAESTVITPSLAPQSPDWLLSRLMGSRKGSGWEPAKPFSTGFENRRTTDKIWDKSRDYDVVAMQRLTQTRDFAAEPNWFVKPTATSNNQEPANNATLSTGADNGKYTWNEMSQILANINTWRQTNVAMTAKGDVDVTVVPPNNWANIGGYNWPVTDTVNSPINPSGGLIANNVTNISRGSTANNQPVVLNQNLGNRPLPYINEVGLTIVSSGGKLMNFNVNVEMWNPAYVPTSEPWDLGILILLPEAPYAVGAEQGTITSGIRAPDETYYSNAALSGNGSMMYGDHNNPERYRTLTYREMDGSGGTLPVAPQAAQAGYGPASMRGSIWRAPGALDGSFMVKGGAGGVEGLYKNANTGVVDCPTNSLGGGTIECSNFDRTLGHKTKYLGRWHAPITTGGGPGRFVVLKNAHLVDWRVPQRLDIALLPNKVRYGNYGLVPGGLSDYTLGVNSFGGLSFVQADDGFIDVNPDDAEDGRKINTAVAVAVMKMPSHNNNQKVLTIFDEFPTLAAGSRANSISGQKMAPFYQIVPQPRINPRDEPDTDVGGDVGMPQTKYLPFLNVPIQANGTTIVSREVDDPQVGSRAAQIDVRRTAANETNNIVNASDANDWLMLSASSAHSMGTVSQVVRDNYNGGDGGGVDWAGGYTNDSENATGPLLSGNSSRYQTVYSTGTEWPGEVGATNKALTLNTSANKWSTTGTNWTAMGGSKPRFSGWGDGDGDLTSQLIKMNDYEHPAELGYVHTGRPWRTLRFGRSYYGTDASQNIRTTSMAWPQNTIDTTNSVPDWYLFDQFLGMSVTADNAPQEWKDLIKETGFHGSSLGMVTNPRRGTMALNPAIYTAQYTNGVPAALSRLKPLISMFTNVVATADLMNVVQAVYMPTNSIAGSYEGYVPGPTGDRFGIPGVLDSPGELSEVFGRMTAGTVNASAPYTTMVTDVWGGNKPTLPQTGANTVFADGWTKVNNSGTTIEAGASAFPKELLRAVGAQMSPRTRFFHIYVCAQSFGGPWVNGQLGPNTKVTGEFWKEVLVERYNRYNENAYKPEYRIVWEKAL